MKQEDERLIETLRSGLGDLDRLAQFDPPDERQLLAMITEHERSVRRQWRRELGMFLMLALLILAMTLMMLLYKPKAYLMFQCAVLVATPLLGLLAAGKRVKNR